MTAYSTQPDASQIGWCFPPTYGGEEGGFNDPGLAHYRGAASSSLAREIIQNSLDARRDPQQPVQVEFEIRTIQGTTVGHSELRQTVESCIKESRAIGDNEAIRALNSASEILSSDALIFLRVSDRNTTGLHNKYWNALVKQRGTSLKPQEGAGGSHGIGKSAPFLMSPIRTVFYWSRFDNGEGALECLQGKSILTSHQGKDDKKRQGTGFYGIREDCQRLEGPAIPNEIANAERSREEAFGTSLWIAAFPNNSRWQMQVAANIVENFFVAIQDDALRVIIEPTDYMSQENLIEITAETLPRWFEFLMEQSTNNGILEKAYRYWKLYSEEPDDLTRVYEENIEGLGRCLLWVRTGIGLHSRVALVRRTGMLITDDQKGLQRFPGLKDFVALCLLSDVEGQPLLKAMENPRHDQFEPEMPHNHADRAKAKQGLRKLTKWVRATIREHAKQDIEIQTTDLQELAHLLPDIVSDDEPLPGDGEASGQYGDPSFAGALTVQRSPVTPTVRPRAEPEHAGEYETSSEDGDEVLDDQSDFPQDRHNVGEGSGEPGKRYLGRAHLRTAIEDVRLVAYPEASGIYYLYFTPRVSGTIDLTLHEIWDSRSVPRSDVMQLNAEGQRTPLEAIPVREGQRSRVSLASESDIAERAWRISAYRTEEV